MCNYTIRLILNHIISALFQKTRRLQYRQSLIRAIHPRVEPTPTAAIRTALLCASAVMSTSEIPTSDASLNVSSTLTARGTRTAMGTNARTRALASAALEQNVTWLTTSSCATAQTDTQEIHSPSVDRCHKRRRRHLSLSTRTPACHRRVARTPSVERRTTQPCAPAWLATTETRRLDVVRSVSLTPSALRHWHASTRSAGIHVSASAVSTPSAVSSTTIQGAIVFRDMKEIRTEAVQFLEVSVV